LEKFGRIGYFTFYLHNIVYSHVSLSTQIVYSRQAPPYRGTILAVMYAQRKG